MKFFTHLKWLAAALLLAQLWGCKKTDDRPATDKPEITFGTTTGEYKVKAGKDITLSATVANATAPAYSWKLDGKIIGTDLQCPLPRIAIGEYFVTFRVDAAKGSAEEQVKVTVVDKLPPQITLSLNVVAYLGRDNRLAATIANSDDAKYAWRLNGTVVSNDSVYTINPSTPGSNSLTLKVWNDDGEDLKVVTLVVLPPPVAELYFDDGHYRLPGDVSTKRLSIPVGKTLVLAPVISIMPRPATFQWTVDGAAQPSATEYLSFTPQTLGTYLVTVSAGGVTGKVNVECVAAEGTYFRAQQAGNIALATKAFEYVPAPGQFTSYGIGSTAGQATQDLQNSLDMQITNGYIAGLGAYGGYYIVGFDHSVSDVTDAADLHIGGNAFASWSEPGIVWVMQDENGNGLPDDTWYELKGSESNKPETRQRYVITYFKPTAPAQDVLWIDNFGGTGSIDYLQQFHWQPYYFPMFINSDSYMLTGTCLAPTMIHGGIDTSPGYAWGYVDNYGDGSKKDFWIEDAIRADGKPAKLKYIDFVKVHTGITGKGAAVGELSTEAGVPIDLNFSK